MTPRPIELAVLIAAPLDVVQWHWATEAGITRWFIPECTFTSPDGAKLEQTTPVETDTKYKWIWANGIEEEGVFVFVSERALTFTFGAGTTVEVHLTSEGGRTQVELKQTSEVTDAEEVYRDCTQGWTFYLTNLKSLLEGGIDLREFEPTREGLVNV